MPNYLFSTFEDRKKARQILEDYSGKDVEYSKVKWIIRKFVTLRNHCPIQMFTMIKHADERYFERIHEADCLAQPSSPRYTDIISGKSTGGFDTKSIQERILDIKDNARLQHIEECSRVNIFFKIDNFINEVIDSLYDDSAPHHLLAECIWSGKYGSVNNIMVAAVGNDELDILNKKPFSGEGKTANSSLSYHARTKIIHFPEFTSDEIEMLMEYRYPNTEIPKMDGRNFFTKFLVGAIPGAKVDIKELSYNIWKYFRKTGHSDYHAFDAYRAPTKSGRVFKNYV